MRIIAGSNRGLSLANVGKGDASAHLRPTTDRVRESLFNVLNGGSFDDPITDARVLDLFAGTGALGLEALSRGAAHVTFVDDGRIAAKLIRQNVQLTKRDAQTTLIKRDATKLGINPNDAFNLIFLDPPYGKNLGAKSLSNALDNGWITDDALLVFEENVAQQHIPGFKLLDARKYGETYISILERQ